MADKIEPLALLRPSSFASSHAYPSPSFFQLKFLLLTAIMTTKQKDDDWLHSEGRRLLESDLQSNRICDATDWRTVYHLRPEFAVGETPEEALRLFEGRLYRARQRHKRQRNLAASELAMLQHDRQQHPVPTTDRRTGEPRWDGSEAQRLLKIDVKNKVHETMSRTAFYNSRPEYQEFSKATIDRKVPQEVSRIKFVNQYYIEGDRAYG